MKKLKFKKRILVVAMLLFILCSFSSFTYGEEGKIIYLFETNGCISCEKVKEKLSRINNITLKTFDIYNNKEFMYNLAKKNNVKITNLNKVPIAFYNSQFYIGENEIINKLIPIIENKKPNPFIFLLTGLLNGFNPCSIAMYLYIASIILKQNNDKNKLLQQLLCYIFSIYTSYLLIGYIISKSCIKLGCIKKISQLIFGLIFLMLSMYYLRDYLILKLNKPKQLKTQLSKKTRKLMENKATQTMKHNSLVSSIMSGFIVAILSFPCVGQIYVANLFYIFSKSILVLNTFLYLILYSLVLVLPLIIFTFLIYKGKEVFDISMKISNRLKEIKLLTFLFFLIMAIYNFVNIV